MASSPRLEDPARAARDDRRRHLGQYVRAHFEREMKKIQTQASGLQQSASTRSRSTPASSVRPIAICSRDGRAGASDEAFVLTSVFLMLSFAPPRPPTTRGGRPDVRLCRERAQRARSSRSSRRLPTTRHLQRYATARSRSSVRHGKGEKVPAPPASTWPMRSRGRRY